LIRLPLLSTIRASMTNLLCGESRLNPQESTVVNITLISGRTLLERASRDAATGSVVYLDHAFHKQAEIKIPGMPTVILAIE
jgi:hypothetical protein